MSIYQIPRQLLFPNPNLADSSGLLGVGGDLSPERLLLAYRLGIFPWYSEDQPILWWSPDPRTVLFPHDLHVPRSLKKKIRRGDYRITLDMAFSDVLQACSSTPRPGQDSTWLTEEMQAAYLELHRLGYAHSCEAWQGDTLVGGLYGIAVGQLYCGESMFAHADDASKVAFVHLVEQLKRWEFRLIDCQVHTAHLERFGAISMERSEYLRQIAELGAHSGRVGKWAFDNYFTLPY